MTEVRNESGPDLGAVWHYGDPMREQRELTDGRGAVDQSHRGVLSITGPDRLTWLHSLTSQHFEALAPGTATTALLLSPNGHIEHVMEGVDDGETFWAHTEPGAAAALVQFLDSMRFMMRVEVADLTDTHGVVWRPAPPEASTGDDLVVRVRDDALGGHEVIAPLDRIDDLLGDQRAGTWAFEALRIAAGVPRIGIDTDHRTIPNEIGLVGVHLDKGCYRGQETVARVHNLGRPPRRLVLLHLDGSVEALPEVGAELSSGGRAVGFVGSSARHFELGPIALGLVKRNTATDAELVTGEIACGQEPLVDPEVGLHVRPKLR
ncbi:MAG TPA: folate-binding protein YgfZ [Candidatus Avipropionibacterium avicola]|uniref:Folate-binding protein YgfZ n=1 Tax=Candidatus Avipropionibacterium avicola TaxID=2840701 RepID=A0A9D1GX61_9ACTN|nr:folate-binding protein YgfZ [Candidatus Avipropionibacterium avicola]